MCQGCPTGWDTLGKFWISGDPCPHTSLHWGAWTHSSSTPTTYPPRSPPTPPPPTQGLLPVGCILLGGEGGAQPARLPPATGIATLGFSYYPLDAFAAALQGVVADGVSTEVPPPYPSASTVKFTTVSLLHLRFACGMAVDEDLPPIWEAVVRGKGGVEGLDTLHHPLPRKAS